MAKRQKKLQDALDKFSGADTLSTLQTQFLATVLFRRDKLGFHNPHIYIYIFSRDTHPCLQDEGEDRRGHQHLAVCDGDH